jgi:hypothetical protein
MMGPFTRGLVQLTCFAAIIFMAFMGYVTYWNNISDQKRCRIVEGDSKCVAKLADKVRYGVEPDYSRSRHPF